MSEILIYLAGFIILICAVCGWTKAVNAELQSAKDDEEDEWADLDKYTVEERRKINKEDGLIDE